jgi:predicted nucleotidyltransferase
MHTLRRIDLERREDILEGVKILAARLKESFPVREVYLFGSFASGDIHENSDIDLLIVGDFKERIFDRIGRILDFTDLPVEPLVYTPEELDDLKRSCNPFITEILRGAVRIDV